MSSFEEVDITALDYDQLVKHSHHLHTLHADLAKQLENVKLEMGKRTKRPGTRVVGNTSVTLSRPSRFSDDVAKEKLPKTTYRKICVSKADPALARQVLGEESELYKSLCVPADNWTVKISAASTKQKVLDADGGLTDPFEEDTD